MDPRETPAPWRSALLRQTWREAQQQVRKELTAWYVKGVLGECNNNVSKAADRMGVLRQRVYELMEEVGIKRRVTMDGLERPREVRADELSDQAPAWR